MDESLVFLGKVTSSQREYRNNGARNFRRSPPKILSGSGKQDGSEYEPDSLKVMQAALERYLSTQKYPYSLINSLEFSSSRAVLEAKAKQLRMNGYGKRKNRALPYNSAEEESFWSSGLLGDHDGVALTNVNFKNLSEHFGFRGRQDHYDAYVQDFEVAWIEMQGG